MPIRCTYSLKQRGMLCVSLGLGLCLAFFLSVQVQSMIAFADTCAALRSETLRLHVQANSNTVQDQTVKLQVRDAVLAVMEDLYTSEADAANAAESSDEDVAQYSMTKEDAIALVMRNMPQITLAVYQTLHQAGVTQTVTIYITEMYFDTTAYETFTLPAGEYAALRIELGEAQGQNWWCVLYPSLCLSAVSGEYESECANEIIAGDYALRFAVVEWWETWH